MPFLLPAKTFSHSLSVVEQGSVGTRASVLRLSSHQESLGPWSMCSRCAHTSKHLILFIVNRWREKLPIPLPPGAQFTVKEPRSQAVPTGGNVSLSCSSPSATLYYWWVGAPPNRAGITAPRVSLDGAQLNISSFHATDHAGLYSCMVALPGTNAIFTCPANVSHASEYHTYVVVRT